MERPAVSWVLGLTGTPAAKGLMDLWAQCYLLDGGQVLELVNSALNPYTTDRTAADLDLVS